MPKSETVTPLIALMRACTPQQREQIAKWAGTEVSYLYQLGGCDRKSARATLALGIEDASRQMHRKTNGATPIVTVRELSTMCALPPARMKAPKK